MATKEQAGKSGQVNSDAAKEAPEVTAETKGGLIGFRARVTPSTISRFETIEKRVDEDRGVLIDMSAILLERADKAGELKAVFEQVMQDRRKDKF